MLYEIAHIIKDKLGFVWDAIEKVNSSIFTLMHKTALKDVPSILESVSNETFTVRETEEGDVSKLVEFFREQPESAYEFFKPHGFDEKSILKVLRNRAFMTFVVTADNVIVGYFFLRCFINGKCFRGKIVHNDWQGHGIAKQMGSVMTKVSQYLGLRMFGTISPDNIASLASSKASNEIKILKTLENGYYYIEYLPKS